MPLAVALITKHNRKDYYFCGRTVGGLQRVWSLNKPDACKFLRSGVADYAQAIKYRDRLYADGFKQKISVVWLNV